MTRSLQVDPGMVRELPLDFHFAPSLLEVALSTGILCENHIILQCNTYDAMLI